ncbi:MAG: rhamnulokinase [Alicyclobacillus sp.]|nr:rhamnulokinase [Alicyclobacillus sp.]
MRTKGLSVIAADLGASSGRLLVGTYDGSKLTSTEVHRFVNRPVQLHRHLHWNFPMLFNEVKDGLRKAAALGIRKYASFGIDTWAIDFGLIGPAGDLLCLPYHHRDPRNLAGMELVDKRFSRDHIFGVTGIQFMRINTINQLAVMREQQPYLLEAARHLLLMPDLFNYFLTGAVGCEYTNATTTQLLNAFNRTWELSLIEGLGLSSKLFPSITAPGSVVGTLLPEIAKEVSLSPIQVTAVASHDTASAVVGIPANKSPFVFISCGTWSLVGSEVRQPFVDQNVRTYNFSNEGGAEGTIRLLKNVMGLWLLQEVSRDLAARGLDVSYEALEREALRAIPFRTLIDLDDAAFLSPGNMISRIQDWCEARELPIPQSVGEVVRCILESLAFKYRVVIEQLEEILGIPLETVHLVGGGVRNRLLCQWTANATGKIVLAGPPEATAIGNLAVQLMALGEVRGLADIRELVRRSVQVQAYSPQEVELWSGKYAEFRANQSQWNVAHF